MAIPSTYHDSDADDEYERSAITSPLNPTDDEGSQDDTDPPSTEPTPTGFGHHGEIPSPAGTIVGWSTKQCADYVSSISLPQYCEIFLENEIVGEALIALRHDELKEMGIMSVGHRLTILKGVYDMKMKQGVPLDSEHWIPPSAETAALDQSATRDDISRIIRSLELRDHRIQAAEAEIRKMTEEYRKLRDELLPVFRLAKDRSQPLPYHPGSYSPDVYGDELNTASPTSAMLPLDISKSGSGSSLLSRKFSTKRLFLGGGNTPKSSSPTHAPPWASADSRPMLNDLSTLDPSAAAIAANHLSTTNGTVAQTPSPNSANIPSPTSPNTHTGYNSSRNHNQGPASASRATYAHNDDGGGSSSSYATAYNDRDRTNPTPTPRSATKIGLAGSGPGQTPSSAQPPSSSQDDNNNSSSGGGASSEIFKSFRVSMEDPCEKVLPAALKKYNINADWKNYALYIVYGDQERCLGLREKPLILFKQLDREGKKPMFMLRRHAAPLEGHSGPTGASNGSGISSGRSDYDAPISGGGRANVNSIQLPGGVI